MSNSEVVMNDLKDLLNRICAAYETVGYEVDEGADKYRQEIDKALERVNDEADLLRRLNEHVKKYPRDKSDGIENE